jgi:alkylation response protein AidB-like acyl-CoA dehydrogenase
MLDFTDEQKAIQSAIRAWCRAELEPLVPAMEANETSVYPVMRKMGVTFGIPDLARAAFDRARDAEKRGSGKAGGGSTGPTTAILMMELSRVCPGFAMAFGASIGLFGGAVMARGTPEQREAWALPVLTLDKIGAWGLTEPGAGSDAFGSMKTRATPHANGYRLTGSKTFITNAPFADVMLVYARVGAWAEGGGDAQASVRAFLVKRDDPGVSVGPPMKKMGMHSSPTGEIFLDDVELGHDRLLGGTATGEAATGDGRAAAKSSLQGERFGMTPMCLGIVDRCLEESLRYAKEREQWGKPIATFQLVQEKLARIYQARSIMMTLLLRQLESEAQGLPLSAAEASASKLYCARSATECALEAVQVMGGAGYMSGSVVEMLARDAKLFQIGGGTDEVQILRIARELLSAS